MLQGISFKSTSTQASDGSSQNVLQKVKTQAVQFKDTFEKSDEDTKLKINTALAGASIVGTILTMLGARGSKKAVENAAKNAQNVVRKQNIPLKWLGAIISLAASTGLIALNVKFDNFATKQQTAVAANGGSVSEQPFTLPQTK